MIKEEKIEAIGRVVEKRLMREGLMIRPYSGAPLRAHAGLPYPKYFDHTLLKPEAPAWRFEQLCSEARAWKVATVCVPPNRVAQAVRLLAGSEVKVCTVIGFPLGYATAHTKAAETAELRMVGCSEFDMVIPIGMLYDDDIIGVYRDIRAVVETAGDRVTKVILETSLLDEEHTILAGVIAVAAGAAMLKTSTGFAAGGATPDVVSLLRAVAGEKIGVKASGGIRTVEAARACVEAGADRLGTSSTGLLLGIST